MNRKITRGVGPTAAVLCLAALSLPASMTASRSSLTRAAVEAFSASDDGFLIVARSLGDELWQQRPDGPEAMNVNRETAPSPPALIAPYTSVQVSDDTPIMEIEVAGLISLTEDTVVSYLGLMAGQPIDLDRLNQGIHELWSTQLIESVNVTISEIENGLYVKVAIDERPQIAAVSFRGFERLGSNDPRQLATELGVILAEGSLADRGGLARFATALETEYRRRGFLFATVEIRLADRGDGTCTVEFIADEGSRLRVHSVNFEGNTAFSASRLRYAMRHTNGTNPVSRILRRDRFDAVALDKDVEALRSLYRDAGYKNVIIGEPRVKTVSAKPTAAEKDPVGEIAITIPIQEGERWRLGSVSFSGNRKFGDTRLLENIRRGAGGWLRGDAIEASIQMVRDLYLDSGHLLARVDHSLIERDNHIADLSIKIVEGNPIRLGRVEFEGNDQTRDSVLRRSLALEEGKLASGRTINDGLLKLRQLEFFELNDVDPIAFDFNNDSATVDLTVRGREVDPTSFQLGGGYGETDGLFVFTSMTARNFRGRGEILDWRAQIGSATDLHQLAYTIPWLGDHPQDVKFEIFSREQEYALLEEQTVLRDSYGGRVTYRRRLGLFQSLDLSYSYSDVFDRREVLNNEVMATRELDEIVSSLRLSYSFDRVDSRLRPTRGQRSSIALEYADRSLGGTTNYLKGTAGWGWYRPLPSGRAILGVHAEAGAVEARGSRELAYTNLFSLGGQDSVRGFAFSSIWATDGEGLVLRDDLGFPLGGDRFLRANFELHLPVTDTIRAIFFSDAGKVLAEDQNFSLSKFRHSAGIEFRITIPALGAPLRFIWARNLSPLLDDQFERFQFSVGASF